MPPPFVKQHPQGYRYFDPCPSFDLKHMPEDAKLAMPTDGGVWVVDALTGIRYRRVTMDDLPKHATWNTRGKARDSEQEAAE